MATKLLMALARRDAAVLLLTICAIWASARGRVRSLDAVPSWFHHAPSDERPRDTAHPLPAPVVADLDGDGALDLLVATRDGRLQLLSLPAADGGDRGWCIDGGRRHSCRFASCGNSGK